MKKLLLILGLLLTLNIGFARVTIGINNLTTNTTFLVVTSYWNICNSDGSYTGGRQTGPGSLPGPGGYVEIYNDDPYAGIGYSYHLEYKVVGSTAVQTYDSGYMSAGSYAPLFLNGVTPPVYTNYTYCITNYSSTLSAIVTFRFQSSALQVPGNPAFGTVGYAEYATLTPGGSTCFTTPQIEVSPDADVWSASLNSQTIPAPFNPGTNADGSPNITFGNNTGGGGASGTFGGTGATPSPPGGNASPTPTGGTITNAPIFAPGTNSDVLFQAPQGLASESTLNSGFQLLHSDNINLLTGEKIINDTLTAGNLLTMYLTNDLGQIVANTYRMGSNSDQIPTLLRSVTNLLGNLPTNNAISLNLTNTGLSISNYATETTLQSIENAITNSVGMTNADLSQTLASNFDTNGSPFAGASTNFSVEMVGNTNYSMAESAAESAETSGSAYTLFSNFIESLTPDDIEEDFGDPDMTYTFPHFGPSKLGAMSPSWVVDFNPMHNSDVAGIFSSAKILFQWLIAMFYLNRCASDSVKAVELMEMERRAEQPLKPVIKRTYY